MPIYDDLKKLVSPRTRSERFNVWYDYARSQQFKKHNHSELSKKIVDEAKNLIEWRELVHKIDKRGK